MIIFWKFGIWAFKRRVWIFSATSTKEETSLWRNQWKRAKSDILTRFLWIFRLILQGQEKTPFLRFFEKHCPHSSSRHHRSAKNAWKFMIFCAKLTSSVTWHWNKNLASHYGCIFNQNQKDQKNCFSSFLKRG